MSTLSKKQAVLRITFIIVLVEIAVLYVFDFLFTHKSGTGTYLHIIALTVISTPLVYFFIIKPYVIAHEHNLEQLNHHVSHDPLTRLPNRLLLYENTERLMARIVRYNYYGALLYLDLDGFHIINDHHGHDAGDAVLTEVARRISSLVREEDIVGRVSGNAFVIVLDQLSIIEEKANNSATMVAKRIHGRLSETFNINNKTLHVDVSIGQCILTPERTSVEDTIKKADIAMRSGRRARKRSL